MDRSAVTDAVLLVHTTTTGSLWKGNFVPSDNLWSKLCAPPLIIVCNNLLKIKRFHIWCLKGDDIQGGAGSLYLTLSLDSLWSQPVKFCILLYSNCFVLLLHDSVFFTSTENFYCLRKVWRNIKSESQKIRYFCPCPAFDYRYTFIIFSISYAQYSVDTSSSFLMSFYPVAQTKDPLQQLLIPRRLPVTTSKMSYFEMTFATECLFRVRIENVFTWIFRFL